MKYFLLLMSLLLFSLISPVTGQVIESSESFFVPEKYNDQLRLDGQLYLATDVGIFVFEESTLEMIDHWTVASAGLPSDQVESITVQPGTQSLFIGTYDIGAAFQTPTGEWETLPYPEELLQPFNPIRTHAVEFDGADRLLIGSNQGLWRIDDEGNWELFNSTYFEGWIQGVWDLERTPEGEIYVGGNVVARSEGDGFAVFSPVSPEPVDLFAYSDIDLYQHSDGSLWAFTDIGVAGHYQDESWELFVPFDSDPILMLESRGFVYERDGALWKYTRAGNYFRYDQDGWIAYTETIPFDYAEPQLILPFEDTWLGWRDGQMHTLTDEGPEALHELSNWPWPSDQLWIFRYDNNDELWARTGPQTLLNLSTDTELDLSHLGADFYSYEYFFGPEDQLWLFGPDAGLWHLQDNELIAVYTSENTVFTPDSYLQSFTFSADGTPWLLNSDDLLYTFQNETWQQVAAFPVTDILLGLQPGAENSCYLTRLADSHIDILEISAEATATHALPPGWTGAFFRNFPGETPGTLWTFNEQVGQLGFFDGNDWSFLDFPSEWKPTDRPHGFLEREQRLWIVGSYQMAFHDGTQWTYYDRADGWWNSTRIAETGLDREGNIWLTHNGVQAVTHLTTNWGITALDPVPTSATASLQLWPNPVKNAVQGNWSPGDVVWITDLEGRVLQTVTVQTEQQAVDVSRLPAGSYQIVLEGEKNLMGKMLKL